MKKYVFGFICAASLVCFAFADIGRAEEKNVASEGESAEKKDASDVKPPMEAMSAEFMRMVMETSARIEVVKNEMADREKALYETNEDIKTMRAQMIEMQKTINNIFEKDEELAKLVMERDILWTIMPSMPRSASRAMQPMPMRPR